MNHSNNNEFISQHRHKSHPGTCKAWASFDQVTPAIRDSFNVSSITDVGAGSFDAVWDIDFGSTNYAVSGVSQRAATNSDFMLTLEQGDDPTAADCPMITKAASVGTTLEDSNFSLFMAMGDQ